MKHILSILMIILTVHTSQSQSKDYNDLWKKVEKLENDGLPKSALDIVNQIAVQAKKDKNAEIVVGGNYDKSKGYFIEPTVILTTDPHYTTMETELFGPVVTIYVYDDTNFDENKWADICETVDNTSMYGLTGAILSGDRYAAAQATDLLQNAAGNFYINDKPTGAVVGQQPFGGARSSGTNDKAGSKMNLMRWISVKYQC